MNGHIIPGTPIAVDFWRSRDCPSVKFFFLSHLHGDHTVGLSSSWQHNIYCSEITSKLLINKYSVREELVHPLEIGRNHIMYLDEEKQEQMVVNLIDANHCPGSVMFLFEGYFGKVLYTGDFRYTDLMFTQTPLSNCSNIDVLFLDNTYCAPECVFPPREEAVEQIIALIQANRDHRIVIGMRQLGKEDLLVKIALKFQEWISVPLAMYRTAEILGLQDVFCVDDMDCQIRIVPFHTVTRSSVIGWNEFEPTLAILPTSLYIGLGSTPYIDSPNIHIVPYSDHSSFEEICNFVRRIQPKHIRPIVNERKRGGIFGKLTDRSDLSCLHKYLSKQPDNTYTIPSSVKRFMSLPLATSISKVSRQKKQCGNKISSIRKRRSVSLGVEYESPQKVELNESCKEFESKLNEIKNSFKKVQQIKPNLSEVGMSIKQNEKSNKNISKSSSCKNNETVKDFNIRQDDGNNYHFVDSVTNLSESDKLDEVNSVKKFSPIIEKKWKHKVTIDKSPVSSVVYKQNNLDTFVKSTSKHTINKIGDISIGQSTCDTWMKSKSTCLENNNRNVESPSCSFHDKILKVKSDNFSDKTKCSIDSSPVSLRESNDILEYEQVHMIPLKPLNVKRSAPVTPELCVIPIKIKRMRQSSDDNDITPLKKF